MAISLNAYEMSNVEASEAVWGAPINVDLMQMAAVRQLNNARQGNASTKTRMEVRGGGRKPWKQKGTGRARAGSNTSSIWRGGGVSFGPKPRSFRSSINRKMSAGAVASALSSKRDQVTVIADEQLNVNKTKAFVALLEKVGVKKGEKVLILANYNESLFFASRNLRNVSIINPMNIGVVDVLKNNNILVTQSALSALEGRFA
jgi:large subunit ribosomal protein L4